MTPQDLYHQLGLTAAELQQLRDTIALQAAQAAVWDPSTLHADSGSLWSTEETVQVITTALADAEAALALAQGHVESAWSASGRLGTE